MNDQKLWPRVTFVLSFINAITIVIVLTQVRASYGRPRRRVPCLQL